MTKEGLKGAIAAALHEMETIQNYQRSRRELTLSELANREFLNLLCAEIGAFGAAGLPYGFDRTDVEAHFPGAWDKCVARIEAMDHADFCDVVPVDARGERIHQARMAREAAAQ